MVVGESLGIPELVFGHEVYERLAPIFYLVPTHLKYARAAAESPGHFSGKYFLKIKIKYLN